MKLKVVILSLIMMLVLAACGSKNLESMTLLNQDKEEITFPSEKPTLFFFITSYT
jgi:ABC-type glycerol-3-phosphate transport system substrate-binding protein